MADNVTFQSSPATAPSGTVVATDKIDGIDYQRMKLILGANGVNDGDVCLTNPLPVVGPLTDTELRASALPVQFTDEGGTAYGIKQHNNQPYIRATETDQLLMQVLTTLKKIEYHLAIASDTNLNDQDV